MDTPVKYQVLYDRQDRILECVRNCGTGLFLTGGTRIHRFIAPHRYSDDLDLFYADAALFRDAVRTILQRVREIGGCYRNHSRYTRLRPMAGH